MSDKNTIDLSMLLASSVHDIKNSLGMLLNALDEMAGIDSCEDPEQKKHYSVLRSEASRINNALISLLGLYHIGNDHLAVNMEEVYLLDFLEEQVANQALLLDTNDIKAGIHCTDDLVGFFDENLIAGVINNIIVNAAKYTKNSITLNALQDDDYLMIEIADNGDGYPEDILDNFNRQERRIDFASGSTHLGLYFASEIATLHQCKGKKGRIELSNRPEGGGCFRLFLP